jgi:hypothetical protein
MSAGEHSSPLCARVFDRLVESGDVVGDAELESHLGSCMACYRTLTELRDASRLAARMRAGASAERQPLDDRDWTEVADRTTDAVMAALRAGSPPTRARRWWARAAVTTTLVAAAAAVAIFVGRPRPFSLDGTAARSVPGSAAVASTRVVADEDLTEDDDVTELDISALRRLIDRLRAGAPDQLAALAETEEVDGTDGLVDDEAELADELVELDQAALMRVQRSLSGSAL